MSLSESDVNLARVVFSKTQNPPEDEEMNSLRSPFLTSVDRARINSNGNMSQYGGSIDLKSLPTTA